MLIFSKDLLKVMMRLDPIIQNSLKVFFFEVDDGIRYQLHLGHEHANAIDHDYNEDKSCAGLQNVNKELVVYYRIHVV
jgi:hypothetical protein